MKTSKYNEIFPEKEVWRRLWEDDNFPWTEALIDRYQNKIDWVLQYLFVINQIFDYRYQSYSFDADRRIDYLIDLISNYVSEDFSKFTHLLLMFRTSSDYPLAQSELEKMQNFFKQYLPASANIRYGYETDETLDTEVCLLFWGSY